MTSKRAAGSRARRGKWLAVLGSAAAVVAVAAFPGQALAATSAAHPGSVPPHCPTTDLRVDFGKPVATRVANQHRVQITLVNVGRGTCSMSGYPGLDLVGDAGQMRLPVARAAQRYSSVILKRGQHASFTLTYLLETTQEIQGELGAWGPDTAVITAPGSVSRQSVAWRLGPVYWASIQTGRGTYLSAVGR
ncbi:MAG TPA: DUF4232 domain-containing protein [Trebonia sp.]